MEKGGLMVVGKGDGRVLGWQPVRKEMAEVVG
jgi:hypothetical protein